MYAIGIDLGTTNSVVSVFKNGQKESLKVDGQFHLPSVVSFRKNQPVLVGRAAKARLEVAPESTVASAKRFMGDRSKSYQIQGKTYSPVDIAALVLTHAVAGAKKALGQDVFDAVITVPAYFNDEQRADTLRAGEQAGLNVLRLLPEPSAAAISYGFQKQKDQTIMVYDLGGGTFDISLLKVNGNDFDVLAVGGDSRLGGDDFDNAILEWAAIEFKKQHGIDLLDRSNKDHAIAHQRLKEEAEKAKIELSESDYAEMIIPELAGHSLHLELHVDQFNELIKPFLQRTVDCVRQVLHDTNHSPDEIDRILLVGGSSSIPAVRQLIADEIKEPYCDENPNEAIAWGAAIIAASFGAPVEDMTPIAVRDVTAHSLGIGLYDQDNQDIYRFTPLISKNSRYPCQGGVLGVTMHARQQEVQLQVFRGEESLAENNDELGDLVVPIKEPLEELVPVAAVFNLDENGILHFQAVDIPLSRMRLSSVATFLDNTFNNGNMIDIQALDGLVKNNDLPRPERITIASALG